MRKLLFLALAVTSTYGTADTVTSTSTAPISRIAAYDDYGQVSGKDGADVIVILDTGFSVCPDGVYISPSAPGYKTMVSFALTAYTSGKNIRVQAYDNRIWAGSSTTKLCEADAIRLE